MPDWDLHAALESAARSSSTEMRAVLDGRTLPIAVENQRLFAPQWEEAYVDLGAVLTPAAFERLRGTAMVAFDLDRPAAFAAGIDGSPIILVSAGLIDLIAFCACHVTACGTASFDSADQIDPLEDLFLQITANFVDHGLPLGDDVVASTFEAYRSMATHRDCMLLFVLLHELGHIECGHLDGGGVGRKDFGSLLPDLDTPRHALEIEADRFACEAISDPHALFVASTFFSAWTRAQVSKRIRLGNVAHLSPTHPLAVNRLHRLALHLRERRAPDSDGDVRGLEDDVRRCSVMMSEPARLGLTATECTHEQARARHEGLLERYAALIAPLR